MPKLPDATPAQAPPPPEQTVDNPLPEMVSRLNRGRRRNPLRIDLKKS